MSDIVTNTEPVATITDAPYVSLTSRLAEATNSAEESSLINEINSYVVSVFLPNQDSAAASTADTQNPNDAAQAETTEAAAATATAAANGASEFTTQESSEDVLDPNDAITSVMSNASAGAVDNASTVPGTTIEDQTVLGSTAANSYVEASTERGTTVQSQEQTSVFVYSGSDLVESSVPTGVSMGVTESMMDSATSTATDLLESPGASGVPGAVSGSGAPGASGASAPALPSGSEVSVPVFPSGSDIFSYSDTPVPSGMAGTPGQNGSVVTTVSSELETSPTEYYFSSDAGSNGMNLPSGTFHPITSVSFSSESGGLVGPTGNFPNATSMPNPSGWGQNQTILPSSSNTGIFMGNSSSLGNSTGISPPGIGNAACDPHYSLAASSLALMISFFF